MPNDFISNKRYECISCGRKTMPRDGMLTSYMGQFPQNSFLCLRCLKTLDKAEAEKRQAKWNAIAQSAQTATHFEDNKMLSVLAEICREPGWYSIRIITERFSSKMQKSDSKYVSRLLKKLGFVNRKRLTHKKIMHVYIDLNGKEKSERVASA